MLQELPCTGAGRRELRCLHEARSASASEVPAVCHWLCFLYGREGVLGRSLDNRQNKVSSRLRKLLKKKLSVFLAQALRGLPLPGRLSAMPVCSNFLNRLLTLRFVQLFSWNSPVNLFAVYAFEYKLFLSKSCSHRRIPCWLLTNTPVTSAVANFWCHKLIAKVNK